MSIWRPGQKEAVLEQARKRGMIEAEPKPAQKPEQEPSAVTAPRKPTHTWGKMNNTEYEFSLMLERRRERGEIIEWAFEPFPLWLADKTTYTPDFLSILPGASITIAELKELATRPALTQITRILETPGGWRHLNEKLRLSNGLVVFDEIKGSKIWEKNRLKFKMAAEAYRWACFDLWQKKKDGWCKLL